MAEYVNAFETEPFNVKKKECPSCAMEIDSKSRECPICGYEFSEHSPWIKWLAVLLIVLFFLMYFIF